MALSVQTADGWPPTRFEFELWPGDDDPEERRLVIQNVQLAAGRYEYVIVATAAGHTVTAPFALVVP